MFRGAQHDNRNSRKNECEVCHVVAAVKKGTDLCEFFVQVGSLSDYFRVISKNWLKISLKFSTILILNKLEILKFSNSWFLELTLGLCPMLEELSRQKCQEIGEGVELAIEPYVFAAELDAILDVGEFVWGHQFVERWRRVVGSFYLNGNKRVGIAYKEIHFDAYSVVSVEIESIILFDKRVSNKVLVQSAFVGAEVAVHP